MNYLPEDPMMRLSMMVQYIFFAPIVVFIVNQVVRSIINAITTARQKNREEIEAKQQAAKQERTLVATEIVIRSKFADWLETEALRLKIECATHPGEHGWADALAAVEASIAENADRIVALHQHNDETPVKSNGLEAVKQQWEALRVQGTSLKTEVS